VFTHRKIIFAWIGNRKIPFQKQEYIPGNYWEKRRMKVTKEIIYKLIKSKNIILQGNYLEKGEWKLQKESSISWSSVQNLHSQQTKNENIIHNCYTKIIISSRQTSMITNEIIIIKRKRCRRVTIREFNYVVHKKYALSIMTNCSANRDH
jgi:hypothetical protein